MVDLYRSLLWCSGSELPFGDDPRLLFLCRTTYKAQEVRENIECSELSGLDR